MHTRLSSTLAFVAWIWEFALEQDPTVPFLSDWESIARCWRPYHEVCLASPVSPINWNIVLSICREDSPNRYLFTRHLVDDRSDSTLSYYEFLRHIREQIVKWHLSFVRSFSYLFLAFRFLFNSRVSFLFCCHSYQVSVQQKRNQPAS